jgi:hypothetical protein
MTSTLAIEQWESQYETLDNKHGFLYVAKYWYADTSSAFYRLFCSGGEILDDSHASDVAREARSWIERIDATYADFDALTALEAIADSYPSDDSDDV